MIKTRLFSREGRSRCGGPAVHGAGERLFAASAYEVAAVAPFWRHRARSSSKCVRNRRCGVVLTPQRRFSQQAGAKAHTKTIRASRQARFPRELVVTGRFGVRFSGPVHPWGRHRPGAAGASAERERLRRREETPAASLWRHAPVAVPYPQTCSATWRTRRTFAHCSSSVSLLPISHDAKPHCGERHRLSSGTYFSAS